MKKKKKVLVMTLVLFSTSLLVSLASGQSPQRLKRPGFQNQRWLFMEALDLSVEQKQELRKLREEQREMLDQFREKARSIHGELRRLQEDPENNRIQIENLQDELFNLRLEQMKNQYAHRKELKKVFTAEQLKKIALIRRHQMRRNPAVRRDSFGYGRMRGYYRGPGRGGPMRPSLWRWRR